MSAIGIGKRCPGSQPGSSSCRWNGNESKSGPRTVRALTCGTTRNAPQYSRGRRHLRCLTAFRAVDSTSQTRPSTVTFWQVVATNSPCAGLAAMTGFVTSAYAALREQANRLQMFWRDAISPRARSRVCLLGRVPEPRYGKQCHGANVLVQGPPAVDTDQTPGRRASYKDLCRFVIAQMQASGSPPHCSNIKVSR
jgi:hypothetical protein